MSDDFWSSKTVRARKQHRCDLCGEVIAPGQPYSRGAGVVEGDFTTWNECNPCSEFSLVYFSESGEDVITEDSAVEFARELLEMSHGPSRVKIADLVTADSFMRRSRGAFAEASDWGDDLE